MRGVLSVKSKVLSSLRQAPNFSDLPFHLNAEIIVRSTPPVFSVSWDRLAGKRDAELRFLEKQDN